MSEDREPPQQPENPFARPSTLPAELTPVFPPVIPPVVPLGRTQEWYPVHLGYGFPALPPPAPMPSAPAPRRNQVGLVITILIGLVGVTGLVLGFVTYNYDSSGSKHAAASDGTITQEAMCQTIAVASDGNGPSAIPTMPGGQEDLSAMRAAEVQVYQWAVQTETGPLKSELEQENTDAEQFISDFDANPQDDSITPTGVLSLDMSTFTIDQTKVDATCGIDVSGSKGLSA